MRAELMRSVVHMLERKMLSLHLLLASFTQATHVIGKIQPHRIKNAGRWENSNSNNNKGGGWG